MGRVVSDWFIMQVTSPIAGIRLHFDSGVVSPSPSGGRSLQVIQAAFGLAGTQKIEVSA